MKCPRKTSICCDLTIDTRHRAANSASLSKLDAREDENAMSQKENSTRRFSEMLSPPFLRTVDSRVSRKAKNRRRKPSSFIAWEIRNQLICTRIIPQSCAAVEITSTREDPSATRQKRKENSSNALFLRPADSWESRKVNRRRQLSVLREARDLTIHTCVVPRIPHCCQNKVHTQRNATGQEKKRGGILHDATRAVVSAIFTDGGLLGNREE